MTGRIIKAYRVPQNGAQVRYRRLKKRQEDEIEDLKERHQDEIKRVVKCEKEWNAKARTLLERVTVLEPQHKLDMEDCRRTNKDGVQRFLIKHRERSTNWKARRENLEG